MAGRGCLVVQRKPAHPGSQEPIILIPSWEAWHWPWQASIHITKPFSRANIPSTPLATRFLCDSERNEIWHTKWHGVCEVQRDPESRVTICPGWGWPRGGGGGSWCQPSVPPHTTALAPVTSLGVTASASSSESSWRHPWRFLLLWIASNLLKVG